MFKVDTMYLNFWGGELKFSRINYLINVKTFKEILHLMPVS